MTQAELDPLIGRTIAGKFVIEGRLGEGAMGRVYRARHPALGRMVAIKLMNRELAADRTFSARFRREAQAAARLDHPNSVRVIDFGEEPDGLLYIAMELLEGRSLDDLLRANGSLPAQQIVDVLMQTLAALAAAHDAGVIHRDLKPSNIMVLGRTSDEGNRVDVVKVCDFGIAKLTYPVGADGLVGSRRQLTEQGAVVGTPRYMSPEQCNGDPVDARSDLYSVGVILFELLTGHVPFDGPSTLVVVGKHNLEPPPRPSALRPGVDPRLEAVCLKALQKAPGDRHETARAMRAELGGAAQPRASTPAPPVGEALPAAAKKRWTRRYSLGLACFALICLVAATVAWFGASQPAPTRPDPSPATADADSSEGAPSAARVVVSRPVVVAGTGELERFVNLHHGAFVRCYRAAVARQHQTRGASASLHIEADSSGVVSAAVVTVTGSSPPVGGRCIGAALRGQRIDGVGTAGLVGEASLQFEPE